MKSNLIFQSNMFGLKAFFLVLGVLVGFVSCQKDDEKKPDTDVVTEKTIGPEGGVLENNEISLQIPASAFTTSQKITISKSTGTPTFLGYKTASPEFVISGFPNSFSGKIHIKIKATENVGQDEATMVVGKSSYVQSLGKSVVLDEPYIATYNAGWIESDFSDYELKDEYGFKGNIESRVGLNIILKAALTRKELAGDFLIMYPIFMIWDDAKSATLNSLKTKLPAIKQSMEKDFGFDLTARTKWPMKVVVGQLDNKKDTGEPIEGLSKHAFFDSGEYNFGSNSGVLYLNEFYFAQSKVVIRTAAHEFFHLVQFLYTTDHQYDWMREAFSVWYEYENNADPVYVPDVWNAEAYKISLLNGLHAGSLQDTITPSRHGYGSFPVVKYIYERYGKAAIQNIWDECRKGRHPLEVISLRTSLYTEWWSDFIKAYYLGEVHPAANVEALLRRNPANNVVLAAGEKEFTYTKSMHDLSASLFIQKVPTTGFEINDKLVIDITPANGPVVSVYKRNQSGRSLIASGRTKLEIDNWKSIAEGGEVYYLIANDRADLVNFTDKTTVTLKGKIDVGMPKWTKCFMDFQIRGLVSVYNVNTQSTVIRDITLGHSSQSNFMVGALNGLTFTGSNGKENITVTFNPDGKSIAEFMWVGNGVGDYSANMTMQGQIQSTGVGIPWYNWFKANGVPTCEAITSYTFSASYPTEIYTLQSWYCVSANYLHLIFE